MVGLNVEEYIRQQKEKDKQKQAKPQEEQEEQNNGPVNKEAFMSSMYLGKQALDTATGQKSKLDTNKIIFFSELIDKLNKNPLLFVFGFIAGLLIGGTLGVLVGVMIGWVL